MFRALKICAPRLLLCSSCSINHADVIEHQIGRLSFTKKDGTRSAIAFRRCLPMMSMTENAAGNDQHADCEVNYSREPNEDPSHTISSHRSYPASHESTRQVISKFSSAHFRTGADLTANGPGLVLRHLRTSRRLIRPVRLRAGRRS